ncbi:acyl-CoA carboxylase subunit epsilon [Streptomyces albidoflavus]|uniref:acyl-CoA carboxylase subunit epsilon n=1 Tax=Streptomyces albidoflavus TaxID=1886 RepID=UPI00344842D2
MNAPKASTGPGTRAGVVRVVRGSPSFEELAVLIAVLIAVLNAAGGAAPEQGAPPSAAPWAREAGFPAGGWLSRPRPAWRPR